MRTQQKHKTGTRKQWLAARLKLLKAEKELTRRGDKVTQMRLALPWVRIDKEYRFETDQGAASLADLFQGRSQLLVYHFMFGPDYSAGCPACSSIADGFNGICTHLSNHDVMLWAVSRAPYPKLEAYRRRMDWTFPWASSFGGDFNADFSVQLTEEQQRQGGFAYNYQKEPAAKADNALEGRQSGKWNKEKETGGKGPVFEMATRCGTDAGTYLRERPGMSAFVRENGNIYHTYSTYARGLDAMWGFYPWLDRAPKGRNETGIWFRRRDEYTS